MLRSLVFAIALLGSYFSSGPSIQAIAGNFAFQVEAGQKKDQSVSGKVLSEDGTPAANVKVWLHTRPPGLRQYIGITTTTNQRGEFLFEGAPGDSNQIIAFDDHRASRSKRYQGAPARRGQKKMVLKLAPSPSIRVRVIDKSTGRPIENALVRTQYSDLNRDHSTDANGTVALIGLTNEAWKFRVFAKGFAENTQSVRLIDSKLLEVEAKLEPGFEVTGTVTDENSKPLANVGINVFALDPNGSRSTAASFEYYETGIDGKYQLPYLPMEGVRISTYEDNYARATQEVRPTVAPGERQTVDFQLKRLPDGGSVIGVVRNEANQPIANAEIENHGSRSRQLKTTKTDEEGRFQLDDLYKRIDSHSLIVKAPGYLPQKVIFEPGTAETPSQISVTLDKGIRAGGIVVDKNGTLLAGVQVLAEPRRGALHDLSQQTLTDEKGRFFFDSLPSTAVLSFRKSGYSARNYVELDPDGAPIKIALDDIASIRGVVVDAKTGKAISPFRVSLTFSPDRKSSDPSGGLSGAVTRSGEVFGSKDGSFQLSSLIHGMPLQVTITADGYRRFVARKVVATSEEKVHKFELVPVEDTITVAGQLVDKNGEPVGAGKQLRLIVTSEKIPFPRDDRPLDWQSIQSGRTRGHASIVQFLVAATDANGRFQFDEVNPGVEIYLAYWGDDISQARVEGIEKLSATERESLQVKTIAAGTIRGVIASRWRDSIRGIQISNSSLYLEAKISDDNRRYAITNVPPGIYTFIAYLDRSTEKSTGINTQDTMSNIVVKPGSFRKLNFPFEKDQVTDPPATATIRRVPEKISVGPLPGKKPAIEEDNDSITFRGQVVDHEMNGVPGATVFFQVWHQKKDLETKSDPKGYFELRVPKPILKSIRNNYDFWAFAAGYEMGHASVYNRIELSNFEPIGIKLDPPATVSTTIVDISGKPVKDVRVAPYYMNFGQAGIVPMPLRELAGRKTNASGIAQLNSIGPDKLGGIEIRKPGFGIQTIRPGASSPPSATHEIVLRSTGGLRIQLTSNSPVAFEKFAYSVTSPLNDRHTVASAEGLVPKNGQIHLPQVAEGKLQLRLWPIDGYKPSAWPRRPDEIIVFADETTRLEVAFEEGVRVNGRVQTKGSRKPVANAEVTIYFGRGQSVSVKTDTRGTYSALVLPGVVRHRLTSRPKEYLQWFESKPDHSNQTKVRAGQESFELPLIELAEPEVRTGRLVDDADAPLEGYLVYPTANNRRLGSATTEVDGQFSIRVPKGSTSLSFTVRERPRAFPQPAKVISESPLLLKLVQ